MIVIINKKTKKMGKKKQKDRRWIIMDRLIKANKRRKRPLFVVSFIYISVIKMFFFFFLFAQLNFQHYDAKKSLAPSSQIV
jgi:hypothetical protein